MSDLLDARTTGRETAADRATVRLAAGRAGWLGVLRARRGADAVLAGAVAFLLSVAFSWVPSVWFDESATVVSATRSWSQLFAEVQRVDAVHATYYGLMHGWFDLVGYTPLSLRFPSALATGVAAALLVVLAGKLLDRRTAVVAGLVFALLPRVTWMGGEGRSYATATALAVALTLVLVHAATRPKPSVRFWLLYAVLALASGAVFLYVALVVVGHGVTLALWALRRRRRGLGDAPDPARRALVGWLVAAGAAGLALLPLAALSSSQSRQISWITRPDLGTLRSVLTWQWFMDDTAFAVAAWLLVAAGIVVALRRRATASTPTAALIALPWMAVPTLGLIAASLVGNPIYSPRYVTYAAPAVALVMAIGLTGAASRVGSAVAVRSRSDETEPVIRRRWAFRGLAVGLAALAALTAPSYVQQRQPEAKDTSSWSEVSALIAHERSLESGGGDAIVYGHLRRHPAASARNIAYAYPAAFAGLTDVTLKTPAAETGKLWEDRYPLTEKIDRVDGHEYVWLVTSDRQDIRPQVGEALADKGFAIDRQWHFTYVNVVRYRRV